MTATLSRVCWQSLQKMLGQFELWMFGRECFVLHQLKFDREKTYGKSLGNTHFRDFARTGRTAVSSMSAGTHKQHNL